ncbi:hypothetical protein BLNAU_474 [Blattamonas nauphoetae]|uniref:Uncharacterized protein n=1 Tax=Blattamonas nauphoetae TaxID=2049346 RepID=A0ABQ9YLC7_9EUKA|nr:hypothetical protein BLNAU_474 [Blattamonas nauphoetae]
MSQHPDLRGSQSSEISFERQIILAKTKDARSQQRTIHLRNSQAPQIDPDLLSKVDTMLLELDSTDDITINSTLNRLMSMTREANEKQDNSKTLIQLVEYIMRFNVLEKFESFLLNNSNENIRFITIRLTALFCTGSTQTTEIVAYSSLMTTLLELLKTPKDESESSQIAMVIGNISCETHELRDHLLSFSPHHHLFDTIVAYLQRGRLDSDRFQNAIFGFSRLLIDRRRNPLSLYDKDPFSSAELNLDETVEQQLSQSADEIGDVPQSLSLNVLPQQTNLILSIPRPSMSPDDLVFASQYTDLLEQAETLALQNSGQYPLDFLSQHPTIPELDKRRIQVIVEARCFALNAISQVSQCLLSALAAPTLADCLQFLEAVTFRNRRGAQMFMATNAQAGIIRAMGDSSEFVVETCLMLVRNILSNGPEAIQLFLDDSFLSLLFSLMHHEVSRIRLYTVVCVGQLVCGSPDQLLQLYNSKYLSDLIGCYPSSTLRVQQEILICLQNLCDHSITPILVSQFYSTAFHTLVDQAVDTITDSSVIPVILNLIFSINTMFINCCRELGTRPLSPFEQQFLPPLPQRDPLIELLENHGRVQIVQRYARSQNLDIRAKTQEVLEIFDRTQ